MSNLLGKVAEERMLEDAKSFVRASGQFRTIPDLAKLLRVEVRDLDQQLNDWKDRREIFSIKDGTEGELFPAFAFATNRGPQVSEAIPRVLEIFKDKLSDWGIAAWFIAGSSYLDGDSPKDLVEETPNRVVEAARDEMNEVSHG
ncbi:MAG: hypothetical protein WAM85_15575 [Terracidiphilus sp.]